MISIKDGPLYQWDTGRQIEISPAENMTIVSVHFCACGDNDVLGVTPKETGETILADIPNILLQEEKSLKVFLVTACTNGKRTSYYRTFHVESRPKPPEYIYTETEILSYETLDARLTALEGEGLTEAIAAYLEKNPISVEWKFIGEFPDQSWDEIIDILVEEGRYRFSDGEFIYSVKVERPSDSQLGQTYWTTEESYQTTYYRAGYNFDGEGWEFDDWHTYITYENISALFAPKSHSHAKSFNISDFAQWINGYNDGSYHIIDVVTHKKYYVDQWTYSIDKDHDIIRAQRYFEIHEPWKVYYRIGVTPWGNNYKITWDEWKITEPLTDDRINALIDARLEV